MQCNDCNVVDSWVNFNLKILFVSKQMDKNKYTICNKYIMNTIHDHFLLGNENR